MKTTFSLLAAAVIAVGLWTVDCRLGTAQAAAPGILTYPSQPVATIVPTATYYGTVAPNGSVTAGLASVYYQVTNGICVSWFCTNSVGNTNWIIVLPSILTNGASVVNATLLNNQPGSYYAPTSSVASLTGVGQEYVVTTPSALPINFATGLVENNLLRVEGTNALDPANTNVLFAVNQSGANSLNKRIFTNNMAGNWIMADATANEWVFSNASTGMWTLTNATASTFFTNILNQGPWGTYTNGVSAWATLIAPLRINGTEQAFYAQTNIVSVTNTSSAIPILQQATPLLTCTGGGTTNLYPNEIYPGARWQISAKGTYISAVGNAANLTLAVSLGGSAIATAVISTNSLSTNSTGNHFEFAATVNVIGVSAGTASCVVSGGAQFQTTISGTPVVGFASLDGNSFTLSSVNTAPQPVSATLQWGATYSTNNVTIYQAAVTKLN